MVMKKLFTFVRMTIEEIKAYIDSVEWRFAKTMPKSPHWYTIADWNPNKRETFNSFVKHIRETGTPKKFFSATYIYFTFEGFDYWTMNGYDMFNLINRCTTPH